MIIVVGGRGVKLADPSVNGHFWKLSMVGSDGGEWRLWLSTVGSGDGCYTVMSTSTHLIIVPSAYDVDDTFSSTHNPDYTLASSNYFPTSPGNTSPDSSDDLTKYLLASLAISPFHHDPYMRVMQAYNATIFEIRESSHKTHLEHHEEHIETILNHLDKLPLERIENMEDKIKRSWISTLEMIIEDIQVRHQSDMKNLLNEIHKLKNQKGGPPY
ncbi:hypothetical protein Tco_0438252 [Tanacetum coccineum]